MFNRVNHGLASCQTMIAPGMGNSSSHTHIRRCTRPSVWAGSWLCPCVPLAAAAILRPVTHTTASWCTCPANTNLSSYHDGPPVPAWQGINRTSKLHTRIRHCQNGLAIADTLCEHHLDVVGLYQAAVLIDTAQCQTNHADNDWSTPQSLQHNLTANVFSTCQLQP